ncbi:MAG: hypothetical protein NTZ43_00440 [Gemmatimonadetes bacterium]|nr:hypothetical protein [Gemmatimonadota bacterium]
MVLAIGPCFLLAPVVAALALLAIPLWPIALVILLVVFVLTWIVEFAGTRLGLRWWRGRSAAVWRAFLWMRTPWNWFDAPKPPRSTETAGRTDPKTPPGR